MAGSPLRLPGRPPRRTPAWPRLDGLAGGAIAGLVAVAVIRTTMLPTVGTWDTAEAQTVGPLLGTMHPTGFPAYVVLGWIASIVLGPLGSPAFVMNLLSALLVGVAAGGTVVVARRLGAPLPVATAIGVGFALTPIVWTIGNAADIHALHLVLVVLVVLGLLRWERLVADSERRPGDTDLRHRADRAIVLTAAVFGVAVANHGLTLLLVPAVGLYVLAVEPQVLFRPRLVVAALGACLAVAGLLYLELPVRAGLIRAPLVYGHPETWNGFWDIVLARQFQGDLASPLSDLSGKARNLAAFAGVQFGPLAALLPVAAVVTAIRHPRYALLSFVATAITCFFAASYVNAQIDRYYLGPVFFAWTWLAVLGATAVDMVVTILGAAPDEWAGSPEGDPGPAWRRPGTWLAGSLAVVLLIPTAAVAPDRHDAVDRSHETWVETWLDDALTSMAPDAVVISWWSYSTPLLYARLVEGRRTDITILDDQTRLDVGLPDLDQAIDTYLGTRPVYIIRAQPSQIDELRTRYAIEPAGRPDNLYRVTGLLGISP